MLFFKNNSNKFKHDKGQIIDLYFVISINNY